MSAKDRTPTTRILALAAIILVAGLLSFRAYDLFGNSKTDPVGNSVERELTYLLEPITGEHKVRVSVSGRTDRMILIMVDGEIGTDLRALRARVEDVLSASIGYAPDADTLTLTQFPFAPGVAGSLTPLEMAELTGLGLLGLLLIANLLSPARQEQSEVPRPPRADPMLQQQARLAPPDPAPSSEFQAASALAQSKPDETARLVRGWMSYAED